VKTFEFEAIGTKWSIDIFDENSVSSEIASQNDLLSEIKKKVEFFEQTFSRFKADSLITRISQKNGTYELPQEAKPLFDIYEQFYRLTDGLMTPLIGKVLSDAGYDAKYSFQPGTLEKPARWEEVLEYNYPILNLKKQVHFDFGAAGKGYLIDLIGELLKGKKIQSYTIDAGGDILQQSSGNQPLRVALEDPNDASKAIGVANVLNQSICGSAGNRRAWGEFHHIMNPSTLDSVKNILATWVIAETTILADALTTALFLIPSAKILKAYPSAQYLILFPDYTIEKSKNFPGEIFTA
jgi:thiamine biosynthesis lipoprotein